MPHAFVMLNVSAGNADIEAVRASLERAVEGSKWTFELFLREKGTKRRLVCRRAIRRGVDLLVAAGGDGTVCKVADVASHHRIPVLILPVGTGNLIARELGVPLDLDAALEALHDPEVRRVDALDLGDRRCFSKVSMGLYAQIVEQVDCEEKQRLGRLAYARTFLEELARAPTWGFALEIDGVRSEVEATMILVANVGAVGVGELRWAHEVDPSDGVVQVCVIRVNRLLEAGELVLGTLFGAADDSVHTEVFTAREQIEIACTDPAALVRGDGAKIGRGSVSLSVAAGAAEVWLPPAGVRARDR